MLDSHAHLLNLDRLKYRWIERPNPMLTHLLTNYYAIARDFGPVEYRKAVAGTDIAGLVACEFGAVDALAEAQWVQECHDRTGTPDGFIAAIDLGSPDVAARLARYAKLPIVRAVRQPLYWSDDPLTRLSARPDHLVDPDWLRGFEHVADTGLVWDLLLYAEQLPQALPLVERFAEVPIVLEAVGWPLDRSPDGFARWREHLTPLSEHRNVSLKFQGLALIFGTDAESLAPWVTSAIDIFGADRCMFATHLPVDGLLWSAATLISAIGTALTELAPPDHASYFGKTAEKIYLGC